MGSIACGISSRFHGRSRDIRDRTDVQVGVLVLAEGRPADRARSLHRRCAILTTTHLTDFWPCATFNRPPRCSGSIWSSWYGGWDEVERVPVPFLSRRSPAREDGPAQERLQSSMALQHDPWASATTSACQPLRARCGSSDAAPCCVLPVSAHAGKDAVACALLQAKRPSRSARRNPAVQKDAVGPPEASPPVALLACGHGHLQI
jgi:hypothetical protein